MPPSRRILDAQQQLQARGGGVLCYAPSLSAAVHDALFSYWRLPLAVHQELNGHLPTIQLHNSATDGTASSISIDWSQLATCIQRSRGEGIAGGFMANPMETTWAFALQAETLVTNALVNGTEGIRFPAITHGGQLNNLLKLIRDDAGEFYMSFVVLITILERALYDLYHQFSKDSETVSPPAVKKSKPSLSPKTSNPKLTAVTKKKKKNIILRDLLHSETLARVLPEGLLRLLKILFLPSGLNLRNLVWHGFMVPVDFPRCFSCLMVVLLLVLPQFGTDSSLEAVGGDGEVDEDGDTLFNVHSYDDRFIIRDPELRTQLDTLFGDKDELMNLLSDAENAGYESTFIPRGRRNLVQKALRALAEDRDELWFLFALLPVLEHAMRVKFITTNRAKYGISSEYGTAQIDAYYSTLDGFGQKDKHQVLLHSHVVLEKKDDDDDEDAEPESSGFHLNELYTSLPSAALAVCLDQFMMASGPNLRAKLCHGEADLSTLLKSKPASSSATPQPISTASQLMLLAWLSLCQSGDSTDEQPVEPLSRQPLAARAFEKSYSSSFHPFYQLQRALTSAFAVGKEFTELRSRFTRFQLDPVANPDSESMIWVEFPSVSASLATSDTKFGVLEKASRIQEFYRLLETGSSVFSSIATEFQSAHSSSASPPKAKTQAKSFPVLLEQLYTKLSVTLTQLDRHFQGSHDTSSCQSAFLELLSAATGSDTKHEHPGGHIFDEDTSLKRNLEAHLLALSDDDGLSVASCMMEIVTSAQRSYSSFQNRVLELQQLIVEGKARTNHRRSFLNSVFFLPVFEFVLVLCLSLVEHQVLHCVSLAALQATTMKEASRVTVICPQARKFELLQRKLLQFITAFEGCAGGGTSDGVASQKSSEKALLLALQFLDSKAIKSIQSPHTR